VDTALKFQYHEGGGEFLDRMSHYQVHNYDSNPWS